MAQVKFLKIGSDGLPIEMSDSADDLTLASFTITGGGPVLSGTGLDLNNQDVSDVNDLSFNDPTTGTINQTAGALVIDNLMAKERSNVMTTAGDILFPVITDDAGEVDSFRLPALAGSPTAAPTAGGAGFLVYDSTNKKLFAYDGAAWDDLSTVESAKYLRDAFTAAVAINENDFVYISAADSVSKASAAAAGTAGSIGLAVAGAAQNDPVTVQFMGNKDGFTGLTAGSRYFLSAATAGAITATPPAGSGNRLLQVGFAKSSSVLTLQMMYLGARA